jgi:xanthine dehydrogenase accessory factor
METGRPALLEFGVSDEKAWSVELSCGGAIKVLVETIADPQFFARINENLEHRRSTACVVAVESGRRTGLEHDLRSLGLDEQSCETLQASASEGRDKLVETPAGRFFVEFWRPPLRLFIVGAVHIAQALASIAATAGYDVTIVDPRTAFATPERFAGVKIEAEWPDSYFEKCPLDAGDALVALTHEPRIDDPALIAALRSPAFYIGALGSRGSAEKRRQRLRGQNSGEDALARINGPIGLPIAAATPAEIAIAIAAALTAARRLGRAAIRSAAA